MTHEGQRVELTPKEFELLAILVGAPGRVFGREELLDSSGARDGFVEPRTVDVHVARLRAKFTAARPAGARRRDGAWRGVSLPGAGLLVTQTLHTFYITETQGLTCRVNPSRAKQRR